MSLFWRFMVAHFLADFIFYSRWKQKGGGKIAINLIHNLFFIAASAFFSLSVLWDCEAVLLSVLGLTAFRFSVYTITEYLSRKSVNKFLVFTATHFLIIAAMWKTAFLFLDYPLVDAYYPGVALSLFVIWGIPIAISTFKQAENHTDKLTTTLEMLERAAIFIAIVLGSWFWLALIMVVITRIYFISSRKNTTVPYLEWGLTGVIAVILRFSVS